MKSFGYKYIFLQFSVGGNPPFDDFTYDRFKAKCFYYKTKQECIDHATKTYTHCKFFEL